MRVCTNLIIYQLTCVSYSFKVPAVNENRTSRDLFAHPFRCASISFPKSSSFISTSRRVAAKPWNSCFMYLNIIWETFCKYDDIPIYTCVYVEYLDKNLLSAAIPIEQVCPFSVHTNVEEILLAQGETEAVSSFRNFKKKTLNGILEFLHGQMLSDEICLLILNRATSRWDGN